MHTAYVKILNDGVYGLTCCMHSKHMYRLRPKRKALCTAAKPFSFIGCRFFMSALPMGMLSMSACQKRPLSSEKHSLAGVQLLGMHPPPVIL